MKPPYNISSEILNLVAQISENIGKIYSAHLYRPAIKLRKNNRIKTIQSSLAVDGNTLDYEQVTAFLGNKKVLAPPKDILEVKNAIAVYQRLEKFKANSLKSFCKAHKILMKDLLKDAGKLRTKSVGIMKGKKLSHFAPSGEMVNPYDEKLI